MFKTLCLIDRIVKFFLTTSDPRPTDEEVNSGIFGIDMMYYHRYVKVKLSSEPDPSRKEKRKDRMGGALVSVIL